MKQRAGTTGIIERVRRFGLSKDRGRVVKQLWFAKTVGITCSIVAGFLSAAAKLELGGATFAPFGAAFAAAAMSPLSFCREYGYAPAAGAVIGYVLTAGTAGNMKYLAVMALMLALRGFLGVSPRLKNSAFLPCAVSAAAVFFASAAFSIMFGSTLYDVMLALCEACVAGGTAFFFLRSMLAEDGRTTAITGSQRRVCAVISTAILLVGLSSLEIASISIGRVLGAAAVMLCALAGHEGGGAVTGIAAGVACAAAALSGDGGAAGFAMILASFSLGGIISGVFSSFGKLGVAISFVSVCAVCTAAFGAGWLSPLIEACAGAAAFLLVPAAFAKKLTVLAAPSDTRDSRPLRELSVSRLELAAASLKDVSDTTRAVSERMAAQDRRRGDGGLFDNVADGFCRGCYKNVRCWQADYTNTMDVMNGLAELLRRDGHVSAKSLPEHFARSCAAPERLIYEINLRYGELNARKSADARVSHVRTVVTEQFAGMSSMLARLAQELSQVRGLDEKAARLLRETAEKYMLAPLGAVCYTDGGGRFAAELEIPEYKLGRVNQTELTAELCDLLGYELSPPAIKSACGSTRLIFRERDNFAVTSAQRQYSVTGEKYCGDACDSFYDLCGRQHFVISDGMGSGGRAMIDASMATGLLRRLMTSGFDADSALEMVNCAMLVKSGEESLATIDIASVDPFSGRAEFFKAGAAPSYIRRGNRVMRVDGASMPAGILGGISFDRSSLALRGGDLLLMVSDGAAADGEGEWLASELELRDGEDLAAAAQRILETARSRTLPGREDDITVILARIDEAAGASKRK